MNTFADIDIQAIISAAVIDTFSTMLSMGIRPAAAEPAPAGGIRRVAGTLHFAGQVTGIFNTQITFDFGRLMAAARLGMEPDEVESGTAIRDLVAEITTIVGGHLKSALDDAGYPCGLSTPSITHGTDFSIKPLNMDRFERYAFQKDDHVLVIEVGLKEQEGADSGIDSSPSNGASRIPHVDFQKLESLDVGSRLAEAAVEVFDAMFSLKLERLEPVSAAGLEGMRYVSSVCFAGDAAGIVRLHVGRELSRLMAVNRPGMAPEEIEGSGAIEDMLGELGNRLGGKLKSALTDTGLRCALSTPSCTVGGDFRIESLHFDRFERLELRHEDHIIWLEMGLKISARLKAAAPQAPAAAPAAPLRPEPEPSAAKDARAASEDLGLDLLLDIPVELTVELGRTKMPIHELLKLSPGSAVKLARLEGEPVDILANDVIIARGEVVVRHEKYGIRITEITSRMERLRGLK